MADLVIGLAKVVVGGALTKAKAAIEEETRLRLSARRNMVFVTLEFEMIHSFLDDATEERVKSNLVKTWVRQVGDLAYDLEDLIDSVVHLDINYTWYFRLLPPCIAPPPILDMVVEELQEMRTRAEELSKSYLRYNHIMDSDPKLFKLQQHATSSVAAGAVAVNMLMRARHATEMQPCLRDLAQLITKKGVQDLQVISVWETVDGDLGTSSIISKAYNDESFVPHFTCRAWVKIMHPFNPQDFIRSLVAQFCANSCKEQAMVGIHVLTKMGANNEDLAKEFQQLITREKYLIVLEDLSNIVEWHAIRTFLPNMKNGSCIIISTQRFEIASLCIGKSYQLTELKQFSAEHSVCALYNENQGSQGGGPRGDKPTVCEVSQSSTHDKIPSKEEAAYARINIYPLVGRDTEMKHLHQLASKELLYPLTVMSVWGMAGVGKSALVKNLYHDITDKQFKKSNWVDVSHPFNLNDFCRSILSGIHSENDPLEECHQLLNNPERLIVIDELQSTREWDIIRTSLLSEHSKSAILVIASEATVATYCASKEELVFHVKSLEYGDAIALFKKEVDRKDPSFLRGQSDVELQELVLKCGGLPKVIVDVAEVLARETGTGTTVLRSLNERFIQQLETKREYDNLRGLFAWMDSTFRTCPDSFKPCILYLSIFNPDVPIRRRRLVRRWIAEGYSRDNHEASADEIGEKYFSNLLDLSFIEQRSVEIASTARGDRSMVMCKVNGFIHEYIVSRRMEVNFLFELRGQCASTTKRRVRHLIIQESWDEDINVFRSLDLSRLRSLTVFGRWICFFLLGDMSLLRVLDLENAEGVSNDDVEFMVKKLPHLKFLSLRGCMEVTRLPDSMGDMRQLETLDVRHTCIVELPPAVITKLHKLQYIRAGTTEARRLQVEAASQRPSPPTPPVGTPPPSPTRTTSPEDVHGGTAPILGAEEAAWKRTAHPLVEPSSWWKSKKQPSRRVRVAANGGGVEVVRAAAVGIGQLTELHTLGVVNIAGGNDGLLYVLRLLNQLRKLGLSGISHENWPKLCCTISGNLPRLESLSLQLLLLGKDDSYEFAIFDRISEPPKTLKRLKVLYTTPAGGSAGRACISPAWIKKLPNLERFDHELTLSEEDNLMSD